jgi:hypothetical protein
MMNKLPSIPSGWAIVGFVIGVIFTSLLCGALMWFDVPDSLIPTPTPTLTATLTVTPRPTSTATPTITPTPASLDFGWSAITWELSHDNPAIAVGTIRLLVAGGFEPYSVLHNGREVVPTGDIFYVLTQTPICEAVKGVIEVQSADGQRMVREYQFAAEDVPCPTPTPTPTLTPNP